MNSSSGKNHIEYICNNIAKVTGILVKLERTLFSVALFKLYYACIHSYLVNGIAVWGSSSDIHLKLPVKLQEKHVLESYHLYFIELTQHVCLKH